MQKIVVINSKGGSGKTTVSVNLAASLAACGERTALLDLDPQGSSMRWLKQRPKDLPPISGIAGFRSDSNLTRSFQLTPPADTTALVLDTPAGLDRRGLEAATRGADAILMPVMSSDIDIHAATHCIADLLLGSRTTSSGSRRFGIIANRVKPNTRGGKRLERFLENFDIPVVATLRDSVNYTRSVETGQGLIDLPRWQVQKDLRVWDGILEWMNALEQSSRESSKKPLRVGVGGTVRLAFSRSSASS
jgi:chromosome partitioning protein